MEVVKPIKEVSYFENIKQYQEDIKNFNNINNAILLLYNNNIIDSDEVTQQLIDNNINVLCQKCYDNFHNK